LHKKNKFIEQGIHFECQGEGKCCVSRGNYGYVYLSFGDRKRLATFLKMKTAEFSAKFTEKEDGMIQLKYRDKDCPFLKNNRCSVYDARPWQCRTWPFWPENMDNNIWKREIVPYCPGIGKGRLYSAEEIENILKKKQDVVGCTERKQQ